MENFDLRKYLVEGKLYEFVGKELEDRNEPLYNELVPGQGDAETVEGEMLRAINRIVYRFYNDGDKYFQGYGTETAGPAHSFLVNANHPLKSAMVKLFDEPSGDNSYERMLKDVLDMILDYIESRQGKYTPNNVGDMFDYEPEFEDDEEDYDDYYDDEDDDYFQESINEEDSSEVNVFGYQTQHFDVCPGAQSLYKRIMDEKLVEDEDLVMRTAKLQDALFALEKNALENGSNDLDVETAELLAEQIMAMAKMMGLDKEHMYIQGHVDKIKDALSGEMNEADVEVDDDTTFQLSLKHLLDKHIVKKDD